jgi:hypothetical protein
MTDSKKGPMFFVGVSCGICNKRVAWLVNHEEDDRTEIFSMLKMKGTQVACLDCYDKHFAKEVDKSK